MVTEKRRRKRNRLALLLLPILVFVFFMGWSTYWIGDSKRPQKRRSVKRRPPKDENVTLLPAVLEESPTITNE